MCPLRVSLYFPLPSGTPEIESQWPSKPNSLGACFPSVGPPGWGGQRGAWISLSTERTSAILIISHLGVVSLGVWDLPILQLHPYHTPHQSFVSLVKEAFSDRFQVSFIDDHSAKRSALGLPVRGGEFWVFQFHHPLPALQCVVVLIFFPAYLILVRLTFLCNYLTEGNLYLIVWHHCFGML